MAKKGRRNSYRPPARSKVELVSPEEMSPSRKAASRLLKVIDRLGSLCIVSVDKEADMDAMLANAEELHRGKSGSILRVDTIGALQGEELGNSDAYERIRYHREKFGGDGILAFMGFDYDDTTSGGSRRVVQYARSIMDRHEKHGGRWSEGPAVVVLGEGGLHDLQTTPGYFDREHHPIAYQMAAQFALNGAGDLTTTPLRDEWFTGTGDSLRLSHSPVLRPYLDLKRATS